MTQNLTGTNATTIIPAPSTTGERIYLKAVRVTAAGATIVTLEDGFDELWRGDFAAAGIAPREELNPPKCLKVDAPLVIDQSGAGRVDVTVEYAYGE